MLGWDEIEYIGVAKAIVLDGDSTTRHYTTMGLLEQGYPAHLSVYPLFSAYLSVFYKICGPSLDCLYFSNWFAALLTALLLYYTYRAIRKERNREAFLIALFYLIFPGIWRNFNTALMEPVGALLATLALALVVYVYKRSVVNWKSALIIAATLAGLWLYKTIFVGILGAALVFVFFLFRERRASEGKSRSVVVSVGYVFLTLIFFAVIFGTVSRLFFHTLSPFFAYDPAQLRLQTYARAAGGFFDHPVSNLLGNGYHILRSILFPQLVYPAMPTPYVVGFATFIRYFYFFIAVLLLLFKTVWKKMTSLERHVVSFSLISIVAFHIFINVLTRTVPENLHRYTIYYAPLFLVAAGIIFGHLYDSLREKFPRSRGVFFGIVTLTGLVFYVPLFATMFVHQIALEKKYHQFAVANTELVRPYIEARTPEPAFVYYNKGFHTTINSYPIRQVSEDATDEQFRKINTILPVPIDLLFLRSKDLIYINHKAEVEAGKPILDGAYIYLGTAEDPQHELFVVVYGRK